MLGKQLTQAAAGSASAEVLYVDDVFSNRVIEGIGSAQTIDVGIDFAGEGGLIWFKNRDSSSDRHVLCDTERGGPAKVVSADRSDAEISYGTNVFGGFTSTGYVTGEAGMTGGTGESAVYWGFRKARGFFDVVTYTGDGTAGRTVSHSLGSVPGAIWVKCLSHANSWGCYHRSTGNTSCMFLNENITPTSNSTPWNNTDPTSTEFTVGSDGQFNGTDRTYVAYIFAHDDQSFGDDGDEAVIKCDSYTGTGSTGLAVNVGFEPQFLIIKRTDSAEDWHIFDNMRGVVSGGNDTPLKANNTYNESTAGVSEYISFTPTGFQVDSTGSPVGNNGGTYSYIAIRRPHKPPSVGTDVFAVDTLSTSSANNPSYSANFPVDLAIRRNNITSSDSFEFCTRITNSILYADSSAVEADGGSTFLDFFAFSNGWATSATGDSNDYLWMFKRARGFFDILVDNSTTSVARTLNHNLGAAPEFLLAKRRGASTGNWLADQVNYYLRLNTDGGNLGTPVFNTFTSTQFSIDAGTFSSGESWIVYLFASLAGISKVGSYAGTGSDINVDCGFTAGARFVLIKRTDSTGGWYLFDTARGIVAGDDPWALVNSNQAQVTYNDFIDPYTSGFTVTSTAPAGLNASGGTYLFLAIA